MRYCVFCCLGIHSILVNLANWWWIHFPRWRDKWINKNKQNKQIEFSDYEKNTVKKLAMKQKYIKALRSYVSKLTVIFQNDNEIPLNIFRKKYIFNRNN